jgi:hypothetical protein
MRILAILFFVFCCSVTQAATVYELQPPSWLIRGGERSPLVTGMQLQAGDRVIAGKESRVELRFGGDLSLRLGNEGEAVLVDELEPNSSGTVRGNINLVHGPARIRNDANSNRIRITVGDEALELDGRGDVVFDNESNIFSACLLNGRANITPSGKNPTPLKLAGVGRCYVRDGVKEPREVQLKSAQTKELRELTNDVVQRPTVRVGSAWAVRLISSRSEITAAQLTEFVTYAGYPVQLTITGDGENTRFQPIIHDFMSERGATQMMEELKKSYGAGFAKVIRQ